MNKFRKRSLAESSVRNHASSPGIPIKLGLHHGYFPENFKKLFDKLFFTYQ